MRNFITQGLVVFAGVVSIPVTVTHADQSASAAAECRPNDPRLNTLRRFFRSGDCPIERLSGVFLQEADTNRLDWRLLPSISFIESSGGKHFSRNNIFGWENGHAAFPTVVDGIHEVAYNLAHSHFYKDKDLDDVLETYNHHHGYPEKVKSVMRQISVAMN